MEKLLDYTSTFSEDLYRIASSEVEFSVILKEKLNRSITLLDKPLVDVLFVDYKKYKLLCNIFENAIFTKCPKDEFLNDCIIQNEKMRENRTEFISTFQNNLPENISYYYNGFQAILYNYLSKRLYELVDVNYNNGDKYGYINTGKNLIVGTFCASMSLTYGLSDIDDKIFILYVQPFYKGIPQIYRKIADIINNDTNKFIDAVKISFKFMNSEFNDTIFSDIDVVLRENIILPISSFLNNPDNKFQVKVVDSNGIINGLLSK